MRTAGQRSRSAQRADRLDEGRSGHRSGRRGHLAVRAGLRLPRRLDGDRGLAPRWPRPRRRSSEHLDRHGTGSAQRRPPRRRDCEAGRRRSRISTPNWSTDTWPRWSPPPVGPAGSAPPSCGATSPPPAWPPSVPSPERYRPGGSRCATGPRSSWSRPVRRCGTPDGSSGSASSSRGSGGAAACGTRRPPPGSARTARCVPTRYRQERYDAMVAAQAAP